MLNNHEDASRMRSLFSVNPYGNKHSGSSYLAQNSLASLKDDVIFSSSIPKSSSSSTGTSTGNVNNTSGNLSIGSIQSNRRFNDYSAIQDYSSQGVYIDEVESNIGFNDM